MRNTDNYSAPELSIVEYCAEGSFSTSSWEGMEDPDIAPPVNWD